VEFVHFVRRPARQTHVDYSRAYISYTHKMTALSQERLCNLKHIRSPSQLVAYREFNMHDCLLPPTTVFEPTICWS